MRNAATIVAVQNISSVIAHSKDFEGKETVKQQGGDSSKEGSLDASDNNQCVEGPSERDS